MDEDVDIDADSTSIFIAPTDHLTPPSMTSDAPPVDLALAQTSDSTVLPLLTTSDAPPTDHLSTPPMTYIRHRRY